MDSVKEAAERLRDHQSGGDPYPFDNGAMQSSDERSLAAAYLAEHDGRTEWYSVHYFDKDAGILAPFEYPDEGGWVVVQGCDGTLKHAEYAYETYGKRYPQIRIVHNTRKVVRESELKEPSL